MAQIFKVLQEIRGNEQVSPKEAEYYHFVPLRRVIVPVGEEITFDTESSVGSVYFYWGKVRFFTRNGSVANMVNANTIVQK